MRNHHVTAYTSQFESQVHRTDMAIDTAYDTTFDIGQVDQVDVAVAGISELFVRAGIVDDLRLVEELLLARMHAQQPELTRSGVHTIAAGGKRLRAALVLLSAQLGDYRLEHALHPAAAAELIHAASLVHDDLVDRATRRRGRETVYAHWGGDVALMLGDYLFALAAAEMALSSDRRIIRFYADAVQTIVEGELNPVTSVVPLQSALKQYLFKTGSKTAALFEAACKAGMTAAGGDDAAIAALGRFGYDLGMAFQIVDDVLDFVGDEQQLGKPAGNDVLQGTITLPLIYAAHRSDNPVLRAFGTTLQPTPEQVPAIVADVIALGGVERAHHVATRYARRALRHLDPFHGSVARPALVALTQFVVERQA